MTPAEQAARIWERAQRAARELAHVRPHGVTITVAAGELAEDVVRELAHCSGGRLVAYRYHDAEDSIGVYVSFDKEIAGVRVTGFHWRPATEADEALPLRGGRA